MTRSGRPSERSIVAVRALVSDRWEPARWLRARALDRGIGNTTLLYALRALASAGEVEARGQTWTRQYRRAQNVAR